MTANVMEFGRLLRRLGLDVDPGPTRTFLRALAWLGLDDRQDVPLASRPEFKPDTIGLRAALPYLDDFIPWPTVASLEGMAQRLGRL